MTLRLPIAASLVFALLSVAVGCSRQDENQIGVPADTPATGTTSSTNPAGTPAPSPASAASS